MDITSYFQSRVRCLTPATISLAVMAGPEGNFIGSCCPVARVFTLVPPISITSTFIIEVPRRIGEDNRGEVGSRLAAKVRSSRNSPCWQLSAIVHDQPVAIQQRRISSELIENAQRGRAEYDANAVLILHCDGRSTACQRHPGTGGSIITVEILKFLKIVNLPGRGHATDSDFA